MPIAFLRRMIDCYSFLLLLRTYALCKSGQALTGLYLFCWTRPLKGVGEFPTKRRRRNISKSRWDFFFSISDGRTYVSLPLPYSSHAMFINCRIFVRYFFPSVFASMIIYSQWKYRRRYHFRHRYSSENPYRLEMLSSANTTICC